MVTILIVLVGLACAGWLTFLVWQEREGRASPHFVLAVLPAALMLFAVPVAAAVLNLIRGFEGLGGTGQGFFAYIAPLCLAIFQSMWRGGAALLIIVFAAAGHEFRRRSIRTVPADGDQPMWPTLFLAASSLMILPVFFETYVALGIPRMVVPTVLAIDQHLDSGVNAAEVSADIAQRALLTVALGVVNTGALFTLTVINAVSVRFQKNPDALRTYSWMVVVATGLLCAWNIVEGLIGVRTMNQVLG